jgi:hypothetical protein
LLYRPMHHYATEMCLARQFRHLANTVRVKK